MSFQSSGLYPRSSSMSCRTREVGQLSARNARAVCRNMSCSGLKPKSILECPPVSRKSPAALENSLLGLGIEELDTLHVEIDLNFIMHSGAHLGFHTRRKGVALVGEFQYDFRSQRLEHFHGSADGGQVGAFLLRCSQDIFGPDAKHDFFIRVGFSPLGFLRWQREAHTLEINS